MKPTTNNNTWIHNLIHKIGIRFRKFNVLMCWWTIFFFLFLFCTLSITINDMTNKQIRKTISIEFREEEREKKRNSSLMYNQLKRKPLSGSSGEPRKLLNFNEKFNGNRCSSITIQRELLFSLSVHVCIFTR